MNNNQEGKETSSLVALVSSGNYQALREMVKRQEVDLDQTDENLNTALHVAVATKQHNMAVMLLNRGASIDRKDREGRTPLQLARSLGEEWEGMVVAIQLTARRRTEEARREEKKRLVAQEKERQAALLRQREGQKQQLQNQEEEAMDTQEWEEDDGCDPILEAAMSRLSVAREVVKEMEDQLKVAKGGLARLEAQVDYTFIVLFYPAPSLFSTEKKRGQPESLFNKEFNEQQHCLAFFLSVLTKGGVN